MRRNQHSLIRRFGTGQATQELGTRKDRSVVTRASVHTLPRRLNESYRHGRMEMEMPGVWSEGGGWDGEIETKYVVGE